MPTALHNHPLPLHVATILYHLTQDCTNSSTSALRRVNMRHSSSSSSTAKCLSTVRHLPLLVCSLLHALLNPAAVCYLTGIRFLLNIHLLPCSFTHAENNCTGWWRTHQQCKEHRTMTSVGTEKLEGRQQTPHNSYKGLTA